MRKSLFSSVLFVIVILNTVPSSSKALNTPGSGFSNPIVVGSGTHSIGYSYSDVESNDPANGFGSYTISADDNYDGIQQTLSNVIYYKISVAVRSKLNVYACLPGTAGTLVAILRNDQFAKSVMPNFDTNCSGTSILKTDVDPGNYYILVSGGSTGNITTIIGLTAPTCTAALPGVTFANAIDLGTMNINSPVQSETFNFDPANCYGNDIGNLSDDIYYKFTLAAQSTVQIGGSIGEKVFILNENQADLDEYAFNSTTLTTSLNLNIGTYYLAVEANETGIPYDFRNLTTTVQVTGTGVQMYTTSVNYVNTTTFKDSVKTDVDASALTSDRQINEISYFDGLGRLIQDVKKLASPLGKDIIQMYAYDQYGREAVKYLPYTSTTTDGSFNPNAYLSLKSFYNSPPTGIVSTAAPYANTAYLPSLDDVPVEQGAPGFTWQIVGLSSDQLTSTGHTVKFDYGTNDQISFNSTPGNTNLGSHQVVMYSDTIKPDESRTLTRDDANPYYSTGQLHLTITKDENWNSTDGCVGTTEMYKDKEGHIVLKRVYNLFNGLVQMMSTYYVYDDMGNLAFVLPPGASPNSQGVPSQTILDNQCYQYRYDQRNRLVQKKLPGKGWEFIFYNALDQVVCTQDAMQRNQTTQTGTFTKYDAFGKVIITGLITFAGAAQDTSMHNPGMAVRTAIQNTINGYTAYWETPNSTTVTGYSNQAFPNGTGYTFLSINYYDGYTNIPSLPTVYAAAPAGASSMTKGLLTATLTGVLNTPTDQLWSVNYYDDLGRTIKTYKQHYLGGHSSYSTNNYDAITNTYDFTNAVTQTVRSHFTAASTTVAAVTVGNQYTYDHMGRELNVGEQIYIGNTAGTPVYLSKKDYNELGQLMAKHYHQEAGMSTYLGESQYTYNERGWLTSIMPVNNPYYGESIYYDQPTAIGAVAQYNGNISQFTYNGAYMNATNTFNYSYDKLNRLLQGQSTLGTVDESVSYDVMGNIQALSRTGQAAAVLAYTYTPNSNQLAVVTKGGAAYRTYGYDLNGNATTDGGTKNISYNMLNLPQAVSQGSSTLATYYYDADGSKLRNVSTADGSWDYIGGIVYHNGTIAFIQTAEGKASIPTGGSIFTYTYDVKDYLGNVRASYSKNTSNAAVVVQEDDYYPFGLDRKYYDASNGNRYLYNNKEQQADLTSQEDYGARFYDPVIARWNVVDPLAEKSRRFSPYNYVEDNPIRNIDPDGMETQGGGCCLTPPLLGTKYAKAAGEVIINTIAFVSNFIGGENSHRSFSKDPAVRAEATKELKTDATVAVVAVMTDGVVGRVAGSLGTAGVSEAEVSTVGERASEIHSAVSTSTQSRTTIAVGEGTDASGNAIRVVGSSENRLRPAQRAMLKPGEVEATGAGHAETTVLNHALNNGIDISNIGASRPICENCYLNIQQSGANATTPLKKPVKQ
jgi:RHS repeat-associated protein